MLKWTMFRVHFSTTSALPNTSMLPHRLQNEQEHVHFGHKKICPPATTFEKVSEMDMSHLPRRWNCWKPLFQPPSQCIFNGFSTRQNEHADWQWERCGRTSRVKECTVDRGSWPKKFERVSSFENTVKILTFPYTFGTSPKLNKNTCQTQLCKFLETLMSILSFLAFKMTISSFAQKSWFC